MEQVGCLLGPVTHALRLRHHPTPAPANRVLQLAKEFEKGVPADPAILVPRLRDLLIAEFGATPKAAAAASPAAPAGASA